MREFCRARGTGARVGDAEMVQYVWRVVRGSHGARRKCGFLRSVAMYRLLCILMMGGYT